MHFKKSIFTLFYVVFFSLLLVSCGTDISAEIKRDVKVERLTDETATVKDLINNFRFNVPAEWYPFNVPAKDTTELNKIIEEKNIPKFFEDDDFSNPPNGLSLLVFDLNDEHYSDHPLVMVGMWNLGESALSILPIRSVTGLLGLAKSSNGVQDTKYFEIDGKEVGVVDISFMFDEEEEIHAEAVFFFNKDDSLMVIAGMTEDPALLPHIKTLVNEILSSLEFLDEK